MSPTPGSGIVSGDTSVQTYVTSIEAKVAAKLKEDHMKGTMKWLPYMSTFVLNKMCEIVKSVVHTEKRFKDIHLNACAKALFEHCGAEISSTQVYNHLRKWRVRWIQINKLRDLSSGQWDKDTFTILLATKHFQGHVQVHARGAEYLNNPIQNYVQMQTIFSYGLDTTRYAMWSEEPLGTPEDPNTQESDTMNPDALEKSIDAQDAAATTATIVVGARTTALSLTARVRGECLLTMRSTPSAA